MRELSTVLADREGLRRAASMTPSQSAAEADTGCTTCSGTGFVVRKRPYDHPLFGRAEACACVRRETVEARRSRLARISNIGQLARFTFATWDARTEAHASADAVARAFATSPDGWLVIRGPSGCGKTHLAAAIANAVIADGRPALFWVVADLLDALRAGYGASEEELSYGSLFEQVRDAPLLLLDDLDVTSSTAWSLEKLFQVVNHRANAGLPTVFTATYPERLDERIRSRLLDRDQAATVALPGAATASYGQVGGMTRERLSELRFSEFIESRAWDNAGRASFRAAMVAARDYADDPDGWLLITGDHGCGKTHMAAAIANRALSLGKSVFFAVVPDLLDHLRSAFNPRSEMTYSELFDEVRNAGLLILDDLGTQGSTPWADEKLFQVVNYRTIANLPTVVTTNARLESLQRESPRLYSRICDPLRSRRIDILVGHFTLGTLAPKGDPRPRGRGR